MPPSSTDLDSAHASALDVLIVDLQGNVRGKRIPGDQIAKALDGNVRLPLSTQLLDIWGDDIDHITERGLSQGDPDGLCVPALNTLHEVPWRPGEQQVLTSLHTPDGEPHLADPRALLKRQDDQLRQRGLTAVVAVELEFYVVDSSTRDTGIPVPPSSLNMAGPPKDLQLYDLRVRDRLEPFIDRVERYAKASAIPVTTSLLEFGPGQVEMNLSHRSTALQAADDAVLFKRLVYRAAQDEGLMATFMAKPYTEHAGSGMHTHISLVDENGQSVFDGSERLQHGCAGVLKHLPASLAVMAPHFNSWRRLQPESFAPTRLDWGYDHRGVAIRIPETHGKAARVEQRVAGADANPYFVLTAMLAALIDGLAEAKLPKQGPLQPGDTPNAAPLSHDWLTTLATFESCPWVQDTFGQDFTALYTKIKRHEAHKLQAMVTNVDWATYLPQL